MDLLYWFLDHSLDFWQFSYWLPVVVLGIFAVFMGLLIRMLGR